MPIFSTIDPFKIVSRTNSVSSPQALATAVAPQITASQKSAAAAQSVAAAQVNHRPTTRKVMGRDALSTPSILDALRDEPVKDVLGIVSEGAATQYSKNEPAHPFSLQEVLETWKIFVEKIDAPQLKSALGAREPSLRGDWLIEYELDTELQFNRLAQEIKPKLQAYLRHHFLNEAIEIHFKVSATASIHSNIPYTDAERWSSLVEKYPALATLKSKFGLDFEHF